MTEPARLETPAALLAWSESCRSRGESVGMVPTMGALHAGHRSLIDRARAECDRVVVSIFVNPTQFGAAEDFDRYPRPLEADLAVLADAGADAAFVPTAAAMYPGGGARTRVAADPALATTFEGALRPGHFDGVALVVTKLITAGRPHRVYFGQKDAQQVAVVRRLIADLDLGCELVVCPVVRDHDGLALSSRNAYLDAASRSRALVIPEALAAAAEAFAAGERSADGLAAVARDVLSRSPDLHVDYVALVDPESFQPVSTAAVKTQILIAARISDTHLIDVLRLGVDAAPAVRRAVGMVGGGGTGHDPVS
jgi:pantoate--beta-alanine ligase